MREQKWNLGRFIGRSSALLLLFALLFLPSARAEEGENLPKIIIGSDEYQPYSYYNVDGSPQGVDVEMAREAFRRMGYAPVFRHVAWEDKDEALADGTVDCLWSGFMMNNCEDKYTWARLNLFSRLVAVVRADSAYADLADLAGCRAAGSGDELGGISADSAGSAGHPEGQNGVQLLVDGGGVRRHAQGLRGHDCRA